MANQKKMQTILETSVLAVVVIVPVIAIVWYLLGGNDASSAAPATSTPVVTAPVVVPQQPVISTSVTGRLALDNTAALPKSVSAGEIVPFSFTITNTGSGSGVFSYKVYVKWNNGTQDVIDLNSVTLDAGERTDIPESLKFETSTAKAEVYITLQPSGPTTSFPLPQI